MKTLCSLAAGLVLAAAALSAAPPPARAVMVVNAFTTGPDVKIPYDLKQLQAAMIAEFGPLLKDFDAVAEKPKTSSAPVYTLDVQIVAWRPGNAAKRLLVGLGSGREAADITYQLTDQSGKKVVEHSDTIRTNFYSQTSSSGTLAHPFAQKISDRIKDAKLFGSGK